MIIAISSRIGSGKDLVGSIIQYLTGINYKNSGIPYKFLVGVDYSSISKWQIRKFADRLKDIICLLTGCTREQLEDQEFKNKELGKEWDGMEHGDIPHGDIETYRQLLQYLGTDLFRSNLHENVWVNSLMSEYKLQIGKYDNVAIQDSYPNWIITDMRFPNELKAIKDRDGISIRVKRPQLIPRDFEHESETALDDATFDYEIDNDSDIGGLINKIKIVLEDLKIL